MFGIYLLGLAFVSVWGRLPQPTWAIILFFKHPPSFLLPTRGSSFQCLSGTFFFFLVNASFSYLFSVFDDYALLFAVKFDA